MSTRKAEPEWKGNLAEGNGRLKVGSGAVKRGISDALFVRQKYQGEYSDTDMSSDVERTTTEREREKRPCSPKIGG